MSHELTLLHMGVGFLLGLLTGLVAYDYVLPWAVHSWKALRQHAR